MKRLVVVAALLLFIAPSYADVPEAIAAQRRGDYATAAREFKPAAEKGDVRAMISLGLLYYEGGRGLDQNYSEAYSWYLRAFETGNGDAYNNIGVMFRDGLGVPVNRRVAYALFLIVHMKGLGSEATVSRANRNLRREAAELTRDDIAAALCLSEEYVARFVRARGDIATIPARARDEHEVKLRDKDWWLPSEEQHLPRCEPAD
jgi:TPR repeat protein